MFNYFVHVLRQCIARSQAKERISLLFFRALRSAIKQFSILCSVLVFHSFIVLDCTALMFTNLFGFIILHTRKLNTSTKLVYLLFIEFSFSSGQTLNLSLTIITCFRRTTQYSRAEMFLWRISGISLVRCLENLKWIKVYWRGAEKLWLTHFICFNSRFLRCCSPNQFNDPCLKLGDKRHSIRHVHKTRYNGEIFPVLFFVSFSPKTTDNKK